MTGNAFLKRLSFQLDFLSAEDQKVVLDFYQRKLGNADTLLEEETMVKSFGSPEHIAKKLKESFLHAVAAAENETELSDASAPDEKTQTSNELLSTSSEEDGDDCKNAEDNSFEEEKSEPSTEDSNESETPVEISEQSLESETSDDDLIFSRPPTVKKAPEIVHALENKEVKSLFGEKVVIESRVEPIEEIPLEPINDENGFTPEEIELAKAETLEKAESYNTTSFGVPETDIDTESLGNEENEEEREENSPKLEEDEENEEISDDIATEKKAYPGLFNKIFRSNSLSDGAIGVYKALLTVLISPVLLLFFGLGAIAYGVCAAFTVLSCVFLFALIAALVIGGIVELIYGVVMLFDTISVALIEIGVGTVLFSFVTAVAALIYEFIFGIVPKILKKLTQLLTRYFRIIWSYLYGGKA